MLASLIGRSALCLKCLRPLANPAVVGQETQLIGNLGNQVRHAKTWVKSMRKQKLREETVFQYASIHTKRASRVYVWGYAGAGALGVRRFTDPQSKRYSPRIIQHVPTRLDVLDKLNLKAYKVACGYGYTVILCKDGKRHVVYGTGINTDSQLGYHKFDPKSGEPSDYLVEASHIDLPLLYPDTTKIEHVSCGRAHTVLSTDKEGVITLGHNRYGQCGRPIVEEEEYRGSQIINKINFPHNVSQVECGQDHTLLLTEEGTLYSCGLGSDGQTGLGHYKLTDEPTLVGGDLAGEKIVQVSSRADCILAVSDKGDVFGWGNNEYNQLTVVEKDESQVNTPRHLPFFGVGKVKMAAAAGSTCALVNDAGEVFVWGYGILGKGPLVDESAVPTLLPPTLFGRNELHPDSRVEQIACGINKFAAITNHGELYMWGNNKTASLGLGHAKDQYFPYKVMVPADVKQIACGVDHTAVIAKGFT